MISIQEQVRRDLLHREELGRERYGTSLYPYNGREALLDAYEEALDLCQYLRQAIEELRPGLSPFQMVGTVGPGAESAATPSDVHSPAAVGSDLHPLPSSDGFEHFVDLAPTADAHVGPKICDQGLNSLDVGVVPRPACLPVLLSGLTAVHVATAYEFVKSNNDIFIRHRADHTDQGPWCAVLILSATEVEASFAFKKTSNPCEVNVLHDPECSSGIQCVPLNFAVSTQRVLNRRPSVNEDSDVPEYGA